MMVSTLCAKDSFFRNSCPHTRPFRMHSAASRRTMCLRVDFGQSASFFVGVSGAEGIIRVVPSIKAGRLLESFVRLLMVFSFAI